MDVYQWMLMISTHSQRHILQIREVKAHAGVSQRQVVVAATRNGVTRKPRAEAPAESRQPRAAGRGPRGPPRPSA